MSHTLYTIEFDQDDTLHYYVGITTNYKRRMEQHVNGSGAKWIKHNFTEDTLKNAKSQVVGEFTQTAKWEETKKTLELMVMHGINNVRGAEYCKPTPYTESDIQEKAYAVIHHLNRQDISHILSGLKKNMVQENVESAASSAAEPIAGGFKGSTGFAFGFTSAARAGMPAGSTRGRKYAGEDHWAKDCSNKGGLDRNPIDTPPDDVEILRKTMEGVKFSDGNKSTQSPTPTFLFGYPADVKPSNENGLEMQGICWTFYEEHQLKRQLNAHMSTEDIAQDHFRTEGAIAARVKRLSSSIPDVKPSNENGLEMQGICWTFYEEHQLKRQLNAHMSIKDIAQDHFRTEGAIVARVNQLC